MKKTIKQLEAELEKMGAEKDVYYGKYWDLKSREDARKEKEKFELVSEREEMRDQNGKLMEIVRWLINPETTKFPYTADKEQRDERKPFNY